MGEKNLKTAVCSTREIIITFPDGPDKQLPTTYDELFMQPVING